MKPQVNLQSPACCHSLFRSLHVVCKRSFSTDCKNKGLAFSKTAGCHMSWLAAHLPHLLQTREEQCPTYPAVVVPAMCPPKQGYQIKVLPSLRAASVFALGT